MEANDREARFERIRSALWDRGAQSRRGSTCAARRWLSEPPYVRTRQIANAPSRARRVYPFVWRSARPSSTLSSTPPSSTAASAAPIFAANARAHQRLPALDRPCFTRFRVHLAFERARADKFFVFQCDRYRRGVLGKPAQASACALPRRREQFDLLAGSIPSRLASDRWAAGCFHVAPAKAFGASLVEP